MPLGRLINPDLYFITAQVRVANSRKIIFTSKEGYIEVKYVSKT